MQGAAGKSRPVLQSVRLLLLLLLERLLPSSWSVEKVSKKLKRQIDSFKSRRRKT